MFRQLDHRKYFHGFLPTEPITCPQCQRKFDGNRTKGICSEIQKKRKYKDQDDCAHEFRYESSKSSRSEEEIERLKVDNERLKVDNEKLLRKIEELEGKSSGVDGTDVLGSSHGQGFSFSDCVVDDSSVLVKISRILLEVSKLNDSDRVTVLTMMENICIPGKPIPLTSSSLLPDMEDPLDMETYCK